MANSHTTRAYNLGRGDSSETTSIAADAGGADPVAGVAPHHSTLWRDKQRFAAPTNTPHIGAKAVPSRTWRRA